MRIITTVGYRTSRTDALPIGEVLERMRAEFPYRSKLHINREVPADVIESLFPWYTLLSQAGEGLDKLDSETNNFLNTADTSVWAYDVLEKALAEQKNEILRHLWALAIHAGIEVVPMMLNRNMRTAVLNHLRLYRAYLATYGGSGESDDCVTIYRLDDDAINEMTKLTPDYMRATDVWRTQSEMYWWLRSWMRYVTHCITRRNYTAIEMEKVQEYVEDEDVLQHLLPKDVAGTRLRQVMDRHDRYYPTLQRVWEMYKNVFSTIKEG